MAIDVYNCNVCGEDFCQGCEPAEICDKCQNTICQNCTSEETDSFYGDQVICKTCYSQGNQEEKKKWQGLKNRLTKSEKLAKKEIQLKYQGKGKSKPLNEVTSELLDQLKRLQ